VPPPAAATPPNVALSWSPPLRGDEQPEGTATGFEAELATDQVAAPPAGAPGGRVPQPATIPDCYELRCEGNVIGGFGG
jgi:hypothetical protein